MYPQQEHTDTTSQHHSQLLMVPEERPVVRCEPHFLVNLTFRRLARSNNRVQLWENARRQHITHHRCERETTRDDTISSTYASSGTECIVRLHTVARYTPPQTPDGNSVLLCYLRRHSTQHVCGTRCTHPRHTTPHHNTPTALYPDTSTDTTSTARNSTTLYTSRELSPSSMNPPTGARALNPSGNPYFDCSNTM